jgi:inosose dehydratase
MFKGKNIEIGIAPIGWTNDDMPDLGKEISFERCISEMAESGYTGTEIGNKYPQESLVLKGILAQHGLRVANRWFSTFLLTKSYVENEEEFVKQCQFLKETGAKVIGVSEQSYSIQGQMDTPVFEKKYVMNEIEWRRLNEGLDRLGKIALEKFGISLAVHHHMGTVVQTEDEIDKMMVGTNPRYVNLLFDSGHLAYCGEDYIRVLKKYVDRVRHVHLKDIRPKIVKKVKDQHLSFLKGVRLGAFTVPGDGVVDFKSIFEILDKAGYEGWMLVEAEQDPSIANPLEYAKKAREYVRKVAGV